mmetsp:Transcript_17154/g.32557  ORF Transcript_17154/g.32557 Transcript_17154/m.32557 type:complete len:146 (+) Transcript_17154:1601-2038(+)
MKVHDPNLLVETKKFECAICSHPFSTSAKLRRHFRVHTGEKPFACNFCGKKFTQNGSLGRQIRVTHRNIVDMKEKGSGIEPVEQHLPPNHLGISIPATLSSSPEEASTMIRGLEPADVGSQMLVEPAGESLPSLAPYLKADGHIL